MPWFHHPPSEVDVKHTFTSFNEIQVRRGRYLYMIIIILTINCQSNHPFIYLINVLLLFLLSPMTCTQKHSYWHFKPYLILLVSPTSDPLLGSYSINQCCDVGLFPGFDYSCTGILQPICQTAFFTNIQHAINFCKSHMGDYFEYRPKHGKRRCIVLNMVHLKRSSGMDIFTSVAYSRGVQIMAEGFSFIETMWLWSYSGSIAETGFMQAFTGLLASKTRG